MAQLSNEENSNRSIHIWGRSARISAKRNQNGSGASNAHVPLWVCHTRNPSKIRKGGRKRKLHSERDILILTLRTAKLRHMCKTLNDWIKTPICPHRVAENCQCNGDTAGGQGDFGTERLVSRKRELGGGPCRMKRLVSPAPR